jgi:drug/metabolite transporter (DMT)-like permease
MPSTDKRASLWMLCGALFFAVMGVLTHALADRCHWLLVAWVRAGFMLAAMLVLARMAGVGLAFLRPRTLWVRSLAGSFSLVCNFYALAKLPVADALTLSHTYPLWIVVLTVVVYRQAPTWLEACGVACALLGVVLIEGPSFRAEAGPIVVALVSALATSVAMLGLNRLRGVDPRAIVAHFAGVAFVVATVGLGLQRGVLSTRVFNPTTIALLTGVALSGTIGQFCLTQAYTRGRPARLSVVGVTQVLFALGFDVLLWGRVLGPSVLAGFALVLAPSAWLSAGAGRKLAAVEFGERSGLPHAWPEHDAEEEVLA